MNGQASVPGCALGLAGCCCGSPRPVTEPCRLAPLRLDVCSQQSPLELPVLSLTGALGKLVLALAEL